MLDIRRTGSIADVIREAWSVPRTVIPYAASMALRKTAQKVERAIVAEMPRVFDRPVPYTLNALRVVNATKDNLVARVAVKDQAGRGLVPEHYLLPEVEGGPRREKRMERALRFAGLLRPGERAVPGQAAPLDANGNLSGATVRTILRQVSALQRGGKTVAPTRGKRGASARQGYFVGAVGRKKTRGVWLREGKQTKPILIFTTAAPTYRARLDFTGIADRVSRDEFPGEFEQAVGSIMARGR